MFFISEIQENCFFFILKNKFLKIENKNYYQTYPDYLQVKIFNFMKYFLFLIFVELKIKSDSFLFCAPHTLDRS